MLDGFEETKTENQRSSCCTVCVRAFLVSNPVPASGFLRRYKNIFLGNLVPKPAAAPPMAAGYGRSRADIGRCEAQGGAPRPPPQPTGPMGPLGSRPAHLAPWRAVQAPTPRPIRPPAGSAGLVGGRSGWSDMGGHAPLTQPRWQWAVSTPPRVLGGHWGGVAPCVGGCVDLR